MKKLFTLLFFALTVGAFATSVTFQVSMKGTGLDYDSVFVVGSHTDWAFVQMADEGDSLYSVSLNLLAGDTAVYYFITIGYWASDYLDYRELVPADCDYSNELVGWEGDRAFIVPEETMTISYYYGTCDEVETGAGVNDRDENSLQFDLFPNPAGELVTILLPEMVKQTSIEILDISGKTVRKLEYSIGKTTLDVTDLSQGVYLVKVQSGDVNSVRKLIVK
jgi:hypothetical protein